MVGEVEKAEAWVGEAVRSCASWSRVGCRWDMLEIGGVRCAGSSIPELGILDSASRSITWGHVFGALQAEPTSLLGRPTTTMIKSTTPRLLHVETGIP